jgi:hypothetical protein
MSRTDPAPQPQSFEEGSKSGWQMAPVAVLLLLRLIAFSAAEAVSPNASSPKRFAAD